MDTLGGWALHIGLLALFLDVWPWGSRSWAADLSTVVFLSGVKLLSFWFHDL